VDAIRFLIRAGETEKALAAAEKGATSYPLSAEMHFLHGKASIEAGKKDAAVAALRRALFLDRDLAAAHFLLGTAVQEADPSLAIRAFYNAAEICDRKAPLETVPLCEESTAGHLASLARQRIADLTAATGEAL
jgi:chemotaxis protein methyltransferase CheR